MVAKHFFVGSGFRTHLHRLYPNLCQLPKSTSLDVNYLIHLVDNIDVLHNFNWMNKILIRSTQYESCDPQDLSKTCTLPKTFGGAKTCKTTYFCYFYARRLSGFGTIYVCCVKIIALGKNKHWNTYTEDFWTEIKKIPNFGSA